MDDTTLPPLPLPSRRNGTYDSAAFRFYTEEQMRVYARAAVLLDRQQRTPPAAPQGGSVLLGAEWQTCTKLPVTVHVRQQRPGEKHTSSREGITPIEPDDLIMRGVQGEEYPIGREIFERTYRLGGAAPSAEPVEVTVRNRRVWIKRGNQSWMLEYDDEENAEWYAQTLRDAICTPPAPSAEPVCWLYQHGETGRTRIVMPDQVFTNGPNQWLMVGPLYQHPPAPLQPVAWLDEATDCAYTRAELDGGSEQGMRPLYAAPPDHREAMQQALEALEERYIGAPRDNAIDALRAALAKEAK